MSNKISCIAVDDEPLALTKLKEYIARIPALELEGAYHNGMDALYHLQTKGADLLFLDIQMDQLNGIQLLESMRITPLVILTTAWDKYALKGYELDVCDYLLKPISFDRFVKACTKAVALLETRRKIANRLMPLEQPIAQEYIFIKCDYRVCRIEVNDILYIEGCRDYLKVHTPDRVYITLMNFKKIEEQLAREDYYRIHKSYLVPLRKIDSIGKNSVRIGTRDIPVGDVYRNGFFKVLAERGVPGYS